MPLPSPNPHCLAAPSKLPAPCHAPAQPCNPLPSPHFPPTCPCLLRPSHSPCPALATALCLPSCLFACPAPPAPSPLASRQTALPLCCPLAIPPCPCLTPLPHARPYLLLSPNLPALVWLASLSCPCLPPAPAPLSVLSPPPSPLSSLSEVPGPYTKQTRLFCAVYAHPMHAASLDGSILFLILP